MIGPERRRQDDAVPDDHRAGEARTAARCGSARPCRSATSIRAATRSTPNKTVWEEISGGNDEIELGKQTVASRAYVSWFNFKGATQQRKVGTLSGGERNRVHLAKLLKNGSNLLLLDEPTNDLDVDTLRALEEALLQLRRLRRRHQPRPLVPRPHRHAHARVRRRQRGGVVRGQLPGLRGGSHTRRLGAEADQPHRIKYRKLDAMKSCGLQICILQLPHFAFCIAEDPPMCRNIKTLFNFDPPATDEEIRAASLQFVRKLSGLHQAVESERSGVRSRNRRGRSRLQARHG